MIWETCSLQERAQRVKYRIQDTFIDVTDGNYLLTESTLYHPIMFKGQKLSIPPLAACYKSHNQDFLKHSIRIQQLILPTGYPRLHGDHGYHVPENLQAVAPALPTMLIMR